MNGREVDRPGVPGIAHVGDHHAAADAGANIGMAARDHDLNPVAPPALIGVSHEIDVPRAFVSNHILLPPPSRRQNGGPEKG